MENMGCNFISNSIERCTSNNGGISGGQNSNSTPAWDSWQLGTCTWNNNNNNSSFTQDLTIGQTFAYPLNNFEVERRVNEGARTEYYFHGERQYSNTDNHLMCLNLKLGKRHYIENNDELHRFLMRNTLCTGLTFNYEPQGGEQVMGFVMNNKRGRQYLPGSGDGGLVESSNSSSSPPVATPAATMVPRCQVEECHVVLVNAKAYHRRHKVCEMHAKAPKVVVLGLEQRFCQQCSRFHSVSEFDESKRSCRRRLAGHNERRRKSSQHHSTNTRNLSQGNYRHLAVNDGRALSLLSSKNDSWVSKGNLPARCSAGTISELISESKEATLVLRKGEIPRPQGPHLPVRRELWRR